VLDRVRPPSDPLAGCNLVYADESSPVIRRRRAGRGFTYCYADGTTIKDEKTLSRIRALAIPPAYTDVRIAVNPDCHIQATGRDARSRKQYRYHPDWASVRDESKYGTLAAFGHALPELRRRTEAALRRRGLDRERVVGSIVWLLDNTLVRVGNQAYARDNKSFGLTTLRNRHLEDRGSKLLLRFKGKSGKAWELPLSDRRILRVVRAVQELPGQALFQYLDDDGERREVTSLDVNDYIREAAGRDFTSKHFRTWAATVAAASRLRAIPLPETQRDAARQLNAVVDEIAAQLGNTRAVCRSSYIHPAVVDSWLEGTLGDEFRAIRPSSRSKDRAVLDDDELAVRAWLDRRS